jgi:predicted nucleic acid-binding protein
MLCALDSNVMIYAEGLLDDPRNVAAQDILKCLPSSNFVIPVQAIAETTNWLIRKAKQSKPFAAQRAAYWLERYQVQGTSEDVMIAALELISTHNFQAFDAVILSAAAAAGADILLSEDMHSGFLWKGVTVVNPFAAKQHALLLNLIGAR